MFRRYMICLLPFVLTSLLLGTIGCFVPDGPQVPPTSQSPLVTLTVTPTPLAPVLPTPEAAGVAVMEQQAAISNLSLLPASVRPLVFEDFNILSGEMPDNTNSQVVLALVETAAAHVLYSSLPITDAVAWHEYGWYKLAEGSNGSEITLSPALVISQTVPFQLGADDTTLGDSYRVLSRAGWEPDQARRLLLRNSDGQYQLVLLECLPGMECDGSPAPGDIFCDVCDRCSEKWCSWCRNYCP